MANNLQAADLIGKTIVVSEKGTVKGTIAIKGVQDNGFLSCEFKKPGDTATTPMPVSIANLTAMVGRGVWKLQDAATAETVTTEADVEEVDDIKPVVTPRKKSEEPAPAKTVEIKAAEPKPKPKQGRPKQQQPKAEKPAEGGVKYTYATYTTKRGKAGAKIMGFASEDDVFYAMRTDIHASGSYECDNDGNKHYILCFGPRYAEAAKSICKVLNSDKTVNAKVDECKLIVSQATQELATKREEWKQKREERNAEKVKAMTPEEQAMFELFKKFMAGDKDAMAKVGAVMTKKAA